MCRPIRDREKRHWMEVAIGEGRKGELLVRLCPRFRAIIRGGMIHAARVQSALK